MSQPTNQPEQSGSGDTVTDVLFGVVKLALLVAAVVVLLPLVVPMIVGGIAGNRLAKRHVFWITYKHHVLVNVVTVSIVAVVLAIEGVLVARWIASGDAAAFVKQPDWFLELIGTAWPWLLVNLLLGALLLPITWTLRRRRIAERVRTRTIPDVLTQEHIESARKRAADIVAARQLGLRLNPVTGTLTPLANGPTMVAPHPVTVERRDPQGRRIKVELQGIGIVTRATVRTMGDRLTDRRRIPDWTDESGRYIVLPESAGALRVLLIGESGSGKTVLLIDVILSALARGWPVFFIDAKGDPEDADALSAIARDRGYTVSVGEPWNLFTGTAAEITSKLMRALPTMTGDGSYYNDEVEGALTAVQAHAPLTGMRDLFTRLSNPAPHVRDQAQLAMLNKEIDKSGTTSCDRARSRLMLTLDPLEPHLSAAGWSYAHRPADLTIVPLSPADKAQATVGDLMLHDLRRFMSQRLRARDKSPALVIVDEFAQLVTDESDPGDTAGTLYETARSAGLGLILAVQSTSGLSQDDTRRRRALSSGAALIFGRSKDPEDVVSYAGTVMRLEASGAATGEELRSARAQHTYVVPPQDVRQAAIGSFWIIQSGGIASFRALPAPSVTATHPEPVDGLDGLDEAPEIVEAAPAESDEANEPATDKPVIL